MATPPAEGTLSRAALAGGVAVIAIGSMGIGIFSAVTADRDTEGQQGTTAPTTEPGRRSTSPAAESSDVPQSVVNPRPGIDEPDEEIEAANPAEPEQEEQPPTSTGPFTPELGFPRSEIGPLRVDERYVLAVTNAPAGAEYRIVVDERPVTPREPRVPVYFPKPGRHQLQIEVATDDRVELTAPVEIYVSDRGAEPGWRVNLSAVRSRPENWPEALRQFDQFVLDGHEQLELSLSSRQEGSALPYWNYYIEYGEDKGGAAAYCLELGLGNEDCYIAQQ